MLIRPFSSDDYPALVALGNTIFPEYAETVDDAKRNDINRAPHIKWGRFVGEDNGAIVAAADWGQDSGMYHPRKFTVFLSVHPDRQGQGLGKALYDHVMETLVGHDALSVRSYAREDKPRSVRFSEDRNFQESMRYWESYLYLDKFDFSPFETVEAKARENNITFATEAERENDPDHRRRLFELVTAIQADIPRPDTFTPENYDDWEKRRYANPNRLPDANFLALDGDQYVGISNLSKSSTDDHLHTGVTGVLPSHRRKGIALALKLRAVAYAKAAGAPVIRTGNETRNRPMLAINELLGFEKKPAWIDYVNVLKDEE